MSNPKVADTTPEMVNLSEGQTYAWCSCGQSSKKTFCDGSHQGSEFNPKIFKPEKETAAAICRCKHTSNPPYCDGSHAKI